MHSNLFLTKIYSNGEYPNIIYWIGPELCKHGWPMCEYNDYCYQCFKTYSQYRDNLAQKLYDMLLKHSAVLGLRTACTCQIPDNSAYYLSKRIRKCIILVKNCPV
jgi:hypothetical protein